MSLLFTPLKLRDLTIRNRIFLAPMCQYSAVAGVPTDWHLVHLGARASGGAGLVMVEATAVTPEGRISPADCGLWNDEQALAFQPITRFITSAGAVPAIQIAHAGRKAGTNAPWLGGKYVPPAEGGWQPVAPSALAFDGNSPVPRALTGAEIDTLVADFTAAARRALVAGFQVVELHAAHGYLLHQFLSPIANQRTDDYGGSLENRMRLPLRIARAVRELWPAAWPVFVRISATDWLEHTGGGWDLAQSIIFARELKTLGIDLIDTSSGGMSPAAKMTVAPGYQVHLASALRQHADIATGAVGLITDPHQAEAILTAHHADAILLGRELLRNPHWPLHAAATLGDTIAWPVQYERSRK
ncbi:MAG: NADH:flavin oxidoreductase/NADH oxidase [Phycisphaerae bacterium]